MKKNLQIIELFSGTESFSKVARERGHRTFTIDNDPIFKSDLIKDINEVNVSDIPFKPDIIWASPPCQCFSVASIGKNWDKNYKPKNKNTEEAINLIKKTLQLIKELNPKYYFIENPRGMLRKMPMMEKYDKVTVTYCQYGDDRMKPTDIWTNCNDWKPKSPCKNGMTCHISAPRGSRTGTQGLKNAIERARVPSEICLEIIKYCEDKLIKGGDMNGL